MQYLFRLDSKLMQETTYGRRPVSILRILNILWYSSPLTIVRLAIIVLDSKLMINTEGGHLFIFSNWLFITMLLTSLGKRSKIWKLCSIKPLSTSYQISKIQKTCQSMFLYIATLIALTLSLWKRKTLLSFILSCGIMWMNSMCICIYQIL